MTSIEDISQSIQLRLDELLEETDRLRAAIEALSADSTYTGGTRAVQGATRSARPTFTAREYHDQEPPNARCRPVTPLTVAADAVVGSEPPPATPRDRALTELRRELAAGLRNTYANRRIA